MKYAVIKIGGLQYKVSEGEKIAVNKLADKEGDKLKIEEVLLVRDDKTVKVGRPLVKEAKVNAKVVSQFLGEKLHIHKFKAKTGYRRKLGFRPRRTLLEVEKISL